MVSGPVASMELGLLLIEAAVVVFVNAAIRLRLSYRIGCSLIEILVVRVYIKVVIILASSMLLWYN